MVCLPCLRGRRIGDLGQAALPFRAGKDARQAGRESSPGHRLFLAISELLYL